MKKRFNKLISTLLLTAILGGLSVVVYAEDAKVPNYGLIQPEGEIYYLDQALNEPVANGIMLPSVFDGRKQSYSSKIKVKNQLSSGLCWAFSATTAAERNWLLQCEKNGVNEEYLELSPKHLGYFLYNRIADPLGNTVGDRNVVKTSWFSIGGNNAMTIQALASGVGFAREDVNRYGGIDSNPISDRTACYDSALKLKNANFVYGMNNIKQAIKDKGSVAANLYWDYSYLRKDGKSYYFYQPAGATRQASNHEVVIVGWDDNYPATNFASDGSKAQLPTTNGAWIIQNSWGTSRGENGYFYVSYQDAALSDPAYYEVQPEHGYDFNYEYDGNSYSSYLMVPKNGKVANIFTVDGAYEERIKAIGYINQATAPAEGAQPDTFRYRIDIYKNVNNLSDIKFGTASEKSPSASVEVSTTGRGFNTFELPSGKRPLVRKGDSFAVVMTYLGSDQGAQYANIGCEGTSASSYSSIDFYAEHFEGVSFSSLNGGKTWSDLANGTTSKQYSVRLKAYTYDVTGASGNDPIDPEDLILGTGAKTFGRVFGTTRYDTSIKLADTFNTLADSSKFDNVVIAYGENFPDALSASYLAYVKKAPLITVNAAREHEVRNYVQRHLKAGGNVYIIGGTGVISQNFENQVKEIVDPSSEVKRLYGQTRYDTNIAVLKETNVTNEDILVCSGTGFADALSAASVGKPILLVGPDSLTTAQKTYIKTLSGTKGYIIGGTGAVPTKVITEIRSTHSKASITFTRIAGASRYDTSVAVAKQFFGKGSGTTKAVLTYGQNYPDGLSGGPVAAKLKAPLILVEDSATSAAQSYVKEQGITKILVIGGKTLISDASVKKILGV